jgi:hypothetical protein
MPRGIVSSFFLGYKARAHLLVSVLERKWKREREGEGESA